MKARWIWIAGIVAALGVSGVMVVRGAQHQQQMQRLAEFQMIVREGSGQAQASLGLIFAESMRVPKIPAECDRFVQMRRDFIAKVVAVDMSKVPELQREYVNLLNAENDLMMEVGASESQTFRMLRAKYGLEPDMKSKDAICSGDMREREQRSTVRDKATVVFGLEQKLQSACLMHGLACEQDFSKYQQHFAKDFEDEGLSVWCSTR